MLSYAPLVSKGQKCLDKTRTTTEKINAATLISDKLDLLPRKVPEKGPSRLRLLAPYLGKCII